MINRLITLARSVPLRPNALGHLHDILTFLESVGGSGGIFLQPSAEWGYTIKPRIDSQHWTAEEWEQERRWLIPYKDDLTRLLKSL